MVKLDRTNKEILRSLIENSRTSSRNMAKDIGVSHQTILTRLKKLEDAKIIKSYTTVLDWKEIGFPTCMITLVETGNIDPGQMREIGEYVAKDPNIVLTGVLSGEFDLFFIHKFKSEQDAAEKTMLLRSMLSKKLDVQKFRTHTLWSMLKGDLPSHPHMFKEE